MIDVAGIFNSRTAAERARERLRSRGHDQLVRLLTQAGAVE
jgi:hypothetical protein